LTFHVWLGVLAASVMLAPSAHAQCVLDRIDLRGAFGQVGFRIDVADSADERARGLMFVERLPRFSGMLFVYERAGLLSFWMRNTMIPLDMIFIGADGAIVHIHPDAIPHDETPVSTPVPAIAVLEINGGLSAQLGLAVGDVVRHGAFAAGGAIWPCE
jgi:uncharacterized membrane protein (UPF0127 family)